jgi:two-component system chemotaxis response regulator CheV
MTTHKTAAATNRLEILLFRLDGRQLFGINVLKVKEIIPCPRLTQIPRSDRTVLGVAELRGKTLPVIDLSLAIGRQGVSGSSSERKVIIAEFNRTTQGFLVNGVERIIISDWKDVLPPPTGLAHGYITGVIRGSDNSLVQIIDVEKVLGQVVPTDFSGTHGQELSAEIKQYLENRKVLVVDDSSVARHQTARTLEELGIPYLLAKDGREALDMISACSEGGSDASDRIPVVISDIEMPEMDGYQLTRELRANSRYHNIYILLHTSLDGQVNSEQARDAGANMTLTKFIPDLLASEVIKGLNTMVQQG